MRTCELEWSAADYWYARAAAFAPTVPAGEAEWGESFLRRGDFDRAIAHFRKAHAIGTHFADPLEMWGEALIGKNRSDLALAKFEEAARYAPNWGRLHFEWGKALKWTGDRAGAQKQLGVASRLYLAPADRAQLARMRSG